MLKDEDEKDILVRLARLETKSETRWENHNHDAERRHGELEQALTRINNILAGLNCEYHKLKIESLEKNIEEVKKHFGVIWGAFGSVVVMGIILGVWFKMVIAAPLQEAAQDVIKASSLSRVFSNKIEVAHE